MKNCLRIILVGLLSWIWLIGPVEAAPAGGVVGTGSAGSCNETNFNNALAGGGTVTFNCGGPATITLTSPKTISQNTTILGGNVITLTGNLASRLFTVDIGSSFTLRDILLDRAYTTSANGAAIANSGRLTLTDVQIQGSLTGPGQNGGAISTTGPVTISGSLINNNEAGSGGALYAHTAGAQVLIQNTSFLFNNAIDPANGVGGAIWLDTQAQMTATSTTLGSNHALVGGGLYLSPGARATFLPQGEQRSSLVNNGATYDGGAIFNEAGFLTIQEAYIASNQTPTATLDIGFGGAIADEGQLLVIGSTFNTNAGRFGGAVFVGGTLSDASADIQRTEFYGNVAGSSGGGLYTNVDTTTVTIADSVFEFNTALQGGGLARNNAVLNISKSSFTNNSSQLGGGGLSVGAVPNATSAGYVEIHDTTISTNLDAGNIGGGLNNYGQLDLVNVTIKDNHNGLATDGVGATARLANSVLDNPGYTNCAGSAPGSADGNYATDTTCSLSQPHDTQGAALNAMLGPLTLGPLAFTYYHPPLAGSPLIDHSGPGCSLTDQLYALRPNACDIGAVEFGGLLPRLFAPLVRR